MWSGCGSAASQRLHRRGSSWRDPNRVPAVGYGLYREKLDFSELMTTFPVRNERIDRVSLQRMLDLFEQTARELLG